MDDHDQNLVESRVETRREPEDEDQQIREPADDLHTTPDPGRLSDGNLVGENNIRDGRVGGVIGGTHQQGGEGQGG